MCGSNKITSLQNMDESMRDDWKLNVHCPIHKNGGHTACANYRGISLLDIAYEVLSSELCEIPKPTCNKLIGPYQCGFRPAKSTVDQIFTMRQILRKTREKSNPLRQHEKDLPLRRYV
ncbi:unnamed protein product [Ceratitis capitata]|uniref:(Mediterranean fruit fly) hypothetical protein n=1 Tax=Ceratitis capitata TaxID=7213 RepID=A0A811VM53_CERCA|nr:unnamed protein product [Ceratitis capitata]